MSRVYYNQADSRWGSYPYPSKTLPNATIKSGGCGPTSCAMIVSSLKATATPKDMARLFLDNGLRAEGGTSAKAFSWVSKEFGIDMLELSNFETQKTDKMNKVVDNLLSGGMCVAHCKAGGVFSTGGHYIVLAYMKSNNKIVVFDPYLYKNKFNSSSRKGKVTVDGNDVIISVDNFMKYANCKTVYCYRPEQEQTKNTTVLAHVKTKINKAPLRNSKEHNTNKNVITHLKKGTELDILEVNNEWGRAIQGWINLQDCEYEHLGNYQVVCSKINCRREPKVKNDNIVGTSDKGTKYAIYEYRYCDGYKWGRAPQGWVAIKNTKTQEKYMKKKVD